MLLTEFKEKNVIHSFKLCPTLHNHMDNSTPGPPAQTQTQKTHLYMNYMLVTLEIISCFLYFKFWPAGLGPWNKIILSLLLLYFLVHRLLGQRE